ncbi:phosphoadenylyl-sulfate reductase [Hydrogenovibrio sp. SC-1]|uniref:phosphoadenylyl-sulfate reductase n=1 Tax=Hydrogenovibrio sp. SC-1 TaxID=2065820 RepID=UPI000C7DC649|nr:phosphoadenylyl-sulfate reductase [Hydrogenovibrio sp. SC-1]PLA74662.1 phosphoadenylyl-sulfate reductase [Hydrogenovibrio sp. SC-1]
MTNTKDLEDFSTQLLSQNLEQRLQNVVATYAGQRIVFSTSLGAEDQLITEAIARLKLPIDIFTLETGRLFAETLTLLDETEKRYDIYIERFQPDPEALKSYVENYGLNAFYDSIERRKQCCGIRKVEPLNRALAGANIWITGLRQQQSEFRQNLDLLQQDGERQLIKFNPLLDWTHDQLWQALEERQIPINPLHNKGYPSIGCEPCTRAIKPGEDERAGRWWWENPEQSQQECGLHVAQNHH